MRGALSKLGVHPKSLPDQEDNFAANAARMTKTNLKSLALQQKRHPASYSDLVGSSQL